MRRIEFLEKLFFEYSYYFKKNGIDLEGKVREYEAELSEDLDFSKLWDLYKQFWTFRKEPPPPQWFRTYLSQCKKAKRTGEYKSCEEVLKAQEHSKYFQENYEEIKKKADAFFSFCETLWPQYRSRRQARMQQEG